MVPRVQRTHTPPATPRVSDTQKPSSCSTVINIPQTQRHPQQQNDANVSNVCGHLSYTCPHPQHTYIESHGSAALPIAAPASIHTHNRANECPLAATEDQFVEKKYLADYQRCCPPPMFVIMISLLEIGVFVFDYMTVETQPELSSPAIPSDSVLLYRPDRRQEIWRFVSYMVLHANWFHLSFNVVIQLLYGLPLEMVHGSLRIAAIYLAGVFAGSLGTSVVDSEVYLVGASGGVYALLAAQLANILLNFGQMRYGISQLVSVVIFVSCDLGYALYMQYSVIDVRSTGAPSVSYIAHMTGALAGFTIGLLVLKNFEHKSHENLVWWLALGVYSAFTIFAIVFNLMNTVTAQILEEKGEVFKQHLLHDLGVS